MDTRADFDESAIRAAERRLEISLGASDPTAWVYVYTEEADEVWRVAMEHLG